MIDRSSRRRFGQNYLVDKSVIYQIIDKINPGKEDSFIEIGPGQGAITEGIKNNSKNLTLIEIDRENVAYLKNSLGNEIEIFEEDILKIDLCFVNSIFCNGSVTSPVFIACQANDKPSLAPLNIPCTCADASPVGISSPK